MCSVIAMAIVRALPDWQEVRADAFEGRSAVDFRNTVLEKLSDVAVQLTSVRGCSWRNSRVSCVVAYCKSCQEACSFKRRFLLVPGGVYPGSVGQPGQLLVEEQSGEHAGGSNKNKGSGT